jgi:hypothetical protein
MPKEIIFTQYLIKLAYEFLMLPVTYTLVGYLKKADKMDYYDIDTKFTPFSLKLALLFINIRHDFRRFF